MRHILIFALLMIPSVSAANAINDALLDSGFVEVEIPVGENFRKANRSNKEYFVKNDDKKVIIRPVIKSQDEGHPITYKTSDVEYVGTNNGERGGKLIVTWLDGTKKELINDNVVSIIPVNEELYVFTGLAHLSLSRGVVYKISSIKTKPTVQKLALLSDAPRVVLRDTQRHDLHKFILITSGGIIIFTADTEDLDVPSTGLFWSGLYPNSAVQIGNTFLIGMRSGVALVELKHNRISSIKYFTSGKI